MNKKRYTVKQTINHFKPIILLFIGFFLLLFTSSCNSSKTSIIWINSFKTECSAGAGEMQCMSIFRGDGTDDAVWELFYTPIEGFIFDPGYFQKIKITQEHLDKRNVPADGSSIKYTLVKTLEKKMDKRIILNDIWVPNRIYQNPINNKKTFPQMEINLSKMQVFGNNGCNNFNGKIKHITSSNIQFGNFASTRKMCLDMSIPDLFDKAMNASASYKIENTVLTFYDRENNETINFIKID